jgi:glycosyltransferase involved in cell wall biosynthesis
VVLNAEPHPRPAAFSPPIHSPNPSRRLRILHVFRAPVGGLFRHVVDVARAQIARGLDVGIFCDSSTGGDRAAQALAELRPGLALGVTRVPMRRNPHPLDAAALLSFGQVYRALKPNVLHAHGSKGGAYARMAFAPSLDRQTVRAYTSHGGSFNYKPGTFMHGLYMTAEGILAKRTDVFLFESGYIGGRFRESVGETAKIVRIVHNGIGETEFEPIAHVPDPFDLVYVGELRPAKGIETLIDAVAHLRREKSRRLTMLIVGSGPDDQALQARAKDAGIWIRSLSCRLSPRGAIMVIPSYAESLPYVILEAVAAAQPLVSTNVGGIPEIFGPHADELIPPRHAGARGCDPLEMQRKPGGTPPQGAAPERFRALPLLAEANGRRRARRLRGGVRGARHPGLRFAHTSFPEFSSLTRMESRACSSKAPSSRFMRRRTASARLGFGPLCAAIHRSSAATSARESRTVTDRSPAPSGNGSQAVDVGIRIVLLMITRKRGRPVPAR